MQQFINDVGPMVFDYSVNEQKYILDLFIGYNILKLAETRKI